MDDNSNKNWKHIVILTGAGISQESGIKTFRDHSGLWENHPIEEVASPEGFAADPILVHNFYNLRRCQLDEVDPNPAHFAIAKAEKEGQRITIITQNVDDLHERAGSQNILHIHGELKKVRNLHTGEISEFSGAIPEKDYGTLRPHIVWFGEQVLCTEEIYEAISSCDLFMCIGTSNQVYPAAGLVHQAKSNGAYCVELNLEQTELSSLYDKNIFGKAGEIVPTFFENLNRDLK